MKSKPEPGGGGGHNRRWTEAEQAEVLRAAESVRSRGETQTLANRTLAELARRLGRTPSAIEKRASRIHAQRYHEAEIPTRAAERRMEVTVHIPCESESRYAKCGCRVPEGNGHYRQRWLESGTSEELADTESVIYSEGGSACPNWWQCGDIRPLCLVQLRPCSRCFDRETAPTPRKDDPEQGNNRACQDIGEKMEAYWEQRRAGRWS